MAEISTKTLAVLLVVLVVISMISLFITITRVSEPGITGYASSVGAGITNVTVVEATYINVTDNFIDMGVLEPGQAKDSETVNDFFLLQNDGSVDINVSVYDSGAGPFSGTGCSSLPNACYQVHGNSSQSGEIDATYTNVPALAANRHKVCNNIAFGNAIDECRIGIKMTVPVDEPAGDKSTTMVIVGEKA